MVYQNTAQCQLWTSPHSCVIENGWTRPIITENYEEINLLEFFQRGEIYKGIRMKMVNGVSTQFYLLEESKKKH